MADAYPAVRPPTNPRGRAVTGMTTAGVEICLVWHGFLVVVRVHCPRCGARYETTLPAAGVRRVARCAVCNRTGLEVVDEDARQPAPQEPVPEERR
jgi:hypothetical protein